MTASADATMTQSGLGMICDQLRGMVRIADEVWAEWRKRSEMDDEWSLLMLLTPTGDRRAAVHAVRESVHEVLEAHEAGTLGSDDPESAGGEWRWMRAGDGILVAVTECDEFDRILPAIVVALNQRGIAGTLTVQEPRELATATRKTRALFCHVRVRGERFAMSRGYRWKPDRQAQASVVEAAERWCKQLGGAAGYTINAPIGPVSVEPTETVADRVLDALADNQSADLFAVVDDQFRGMRARPYSGAVTLDVGIEDGQWEPRLAELMDLLRDNADHLVYGRIRCGRAFLWDRFSEIDDWPTRPGHKPRGPGFAGESFEDVFAPDAYGAQLLGPGYEGRVPVREAWAQTRAGSATLLTHTDPVVWFGAPWHVEPAIKPDDRHEPEVLARARVDLAPILYTPGALHREGYVDEESL